ncbi:hypothetical protein BLNAU_6572 [Blattamonas nauphoetae]|uniref:Uncharacterized protein n=1 Tax=Blattamonas nauphoetae TaxID=2049346 RepID=A0ABQ9Y4B5_9EUKA|nr:hypothetical protein BLNAU_6572 [Blattamonas nauphoetae]
MCGGLLLIIFHVNGLTFSPRFFSRTPQPSLVQNSVNTFTHQKINLKFEPLDNTLNSSILLLHSTVNLCSQGKVTLLPVFPSSTFVLDGSKLSSTNFVITVPRAQYPIILIDGKDENHLSSFTFNQQLTDPLTNPIISLPTGSLICSDLHFDSIHFSPQNQDRIACVVSSNANNRLSLKHSSFRSIHNPSGSAGISLSSKIASNTEHIGMEFTDLSGTDGSAIKFDSSTDSTLTITSCLFSSCRASNRGGALYFLLTAEGATVDVQFCHFMENTAAHGSDLCIRYSTSDYIPTPSSFRGCLTDCVDDSNVQTIRMKQTESLEKYYVQYAEIIVPSPAFVDNSNVHFLSLSEQSSSSEPCGSFQTPCTSVNLLINQYRNMKGVLNTILCDTGTFNSPPIQLSADIVPTLSIQGSGESHTIFSTLLQEYKPLFIIPVATALHLRNLAITPQVHDPEGENALKTVPGIAYVAKGGDLWLEKVTFKHFNGSMDIKIGSITDDAISTSAILSEGFFFAHELTFNNISLNNTNLILVRGGSKEHFFFVDPNRIVKFEKSVDSDSDFTLVNSMFQDCVCNQSHMLVTEEPGSASSTSTQAYLLVHTTFMACNSNFTHKNPTTQRLIESSKASSLILHNATNHTFSYVGCSFLYCKTNSRSLIRIQLDTAAPKQTLFETSRFVECSATPHNNDTFPENLGEYDTVQECGLVLFTSHQPSEDPTEIIATSSIPTTPTAIVSHCIFDRLHSFSGSSVVFQRVSGSISNSDILYPLCYSNQIICNNSRVVFQHTRIDGYPFFKQTTPTIEMKYDHSVDELEPVQLCPHNENGGVQFSTIKYGMISTLNSILDIVDSSFIHSKHGVCRGQDSNITVSATTFIDCTIGYSGTFEKTAFIGSFVSCNVLFTECVLEGINTETCVPGTSLGKVGLFSRDSTITIQTVATAKTMMLGGSDSCLELISTSKPTLERADLRQYVNLNKTVTLTLYLQGADFDPAGFTVHLKFSPTTESKKSTSNAEDQIFSVIPPTTTMAMTNVTLPPFNAIFDLDTFVAEAVVSNSFDDSGDRSQINWADSVPVSLYEIVEINYRPLGSDSVWTIILPIILVVTVFITMAIVILVYLWWQQKKRKELLESLKKKELPEPLVPENDEEYEPSPLDDSSRLPFQPIFRKRQIKTPSTLSNIIPFHSPLSSLFHQFHNRYPRNSMQFNRLHSSDSDQLLTMPNTHSQNEPSSDSAANTVLPDVNKIEQTGKKGNIKDDWDDEDWDEEDLDIVLDDEHKALLN